MITLENIFLILVVDISISIAIKIVLLLTGLYKTLSIKIKLPKSKKDKNKDFYYKLTELGDYDIYQENLYCIHKYVYIQTEDNIVNILLQLICPIPLIIYKYDYEKELTFYCEIKDFSTFTYDDMVNFYETRKKEKLEQYENDIKETNKKNNLINNINNKNY